MSLTVSDAAEHALRYGWVQHCRVESWRGGELLADDVPISAGWEEADRTLVVPERVTLTVPRRRDGVDWAPGDDDDHPLAANGQRIRVSLGIGLSHGAVEWFPRGEFVIYESEPEGASVIVDARGLLHLIDEARLVSPYQPTGTLASTVRGLVEPALTVVVDDELVDRAVPSGINFDEDRIGALHEVLDAWPAQARVTAAGYLLVEPVGTYAGEIGLYDYPDERRTITDTVGKSTRDGAHSVVVARGTAADGGQVQGVAADTTGGPHSLSGPFNPLPVPFYFYSPLLTTIAQCRTAAAGILARKQRATVRPKVITAVPYPLIEAGDLLRIGDGPTDPNYVVDGYRLPYVAGQGPMSVTGRVPL